jgi:predicted transcriptional regulator
MSVLSSVPGRVARIRLGGNTRAENAAAGHGARRGILETFDKLKRLVEQAEDDVRKAEGGNKAAGTRARQTMQEIKNTAQEVRQMILQLRDDTKTPAERTE